MIIIPPITPLQMSAHRQRQCINRYDEKKKEAFRENTKAEEQRGTEKLQKLLDHTTNFPTYTKDYPTLLHIFPILAHQPPHNSADSPKDKEFPLKKKILQIQLRIISQPKQ